MDYKLPIEQQHLEVLNSLAATIGHVQKVEQILQGKLKEVVADNPSKSYMLDGSGRRTGVLILSNQAYPDFVQDSVNKAALAKLALGPDLGNVIIEPLDAGVYSDRTFAVWPIHCELRSQRGLRYFQKRILVGKALKWLRQMTKHTQSSVGIEALDTTFVRSLMCIEDESRLPPELRQSALDGIECIQSERWRPRVVLEHGDLWLKNFLLPAKNEKARHGRGFVIIDWRGASVRGYPVYDLVRLSSSFGLSARSLRREVLLHSKILSCRPTDASFYLLAALGNIGLNLEHFPVDRYLSDCRRFFAYLKKSIV